ncbi:CBS domain-containing protein [Dactylosporangium sp. CA-092794]|uniref:CBS domain-containing protein n=1 Tax=Dactylosporangium sp. CA-092794 TaxID=3239929 RepID=UPI003D948B40
MNELRVYDVMTPEVVVATADCRRRHIIDVLTDYGVSGLPVVDEHDRVVGMVTEADLLPAVAEPEPDGGPGAEPTAAQLMTSPAITVGPQAPIRFAARLMTRHRIKRLAVVEDGSGRLVGIVTRGDLMRRALRSDAAVERDVVDNVVLPAFGVDPAEIGVEVSDGVVTLRGPVERRSAAQRLTALARAVDGVTGVADELTWRVDDTTVRRTRPAQTRVSADKS